MRVFGVGCVVVALLLTAVGVYARLNWPGPAHWLFWIAAAFLFLWGYNCLKARNSEDHDDSPLYAIMQAVRWW